MNKNEKWILYVTTGGMLLFAFCLLAHIIINSAIIDKQDNRITALEHKQMHTSTTTTK